MKTKRYDTEEEMRKRFEKRLTNNTNGINIKNGCGNLYSEKYFRKFTKEAPRTIDY